MPMPTAKSTRHLDGGGCISSADDVASRATRHETRRTQALDLAQPSGRPLLASDLIGPSRPDRPRFVRVAHGSVDREPPRASRCAIGVRALRAASRPRSRQPAAHRQGMTLAAHVFTSILPILIVAGALRSRLDPQTGPIFAEHLGLDVSTADILQKSLPGGAQELRATGVIGVVLLVIAATSFARALERSIHTIWHTPADQHQVRLALARGARRRRPRARPGRRDAHLHGRSTVRCRGWSSSSRSSCGRRSGGSHAGSWSIVASAFANCCPAPC